MENMWRSSKRLFLGYLTVLALLLCCCYACTDDKDSQEKSIWQQPVIFTLEEAVNRSSQTGTFETGDAIGVFALERSLDNTPAGFSPVYASNMKYIFDGMTFQPADFANEILFSGKKMDFYAYYPYKESNTNINAILFNCSDQTAISGWEASDFLTAVNASGIRYGAVALHFNHKYATIRLSVQDITGITGVSVKGIKTHTTLGFSGNLAVALTSPVSNVGMLYQGASSGYRIYDVTIPVQAIEKSREIFVIHRNIGEDINYGFPENEILEEGIVSYCGIELLKQITILPASNGSTSGGGTYTVGDLCTIKAVPDSGYFFDGWMENGVIITKDPEYSFAVMDHRTFQPIFKENVITYGEWVVSVSANPGTIVSTGGSSIITATAVRDVFTNDIKTSTETGVPVLTNNNSLFTLNGITVSIGNNTTTNTKSTVITATHAGKSATCTLTQSAGTLTYGDWTVTVSANPINIVATGGSSAITSNAVRNVMVNGVVTGTETANPVLTVNNTVYAISGSILTVGNNTTTSTRIATITATHSGKSTTCTVTQNAGVITYGDWIVTVSANPTTIAASGGSSTINRSATRTVYANGIAYTSENATPTLTRSNTAFTLSGTTLSIGNNTTTSSRSTTVTATHGGKISTCTVTQNAGVITYGDWVVTVSANPTTIASTGGSSTITTTATRIIYANGYNNGTQTATPTLSNSNSAFTLSGTTLTVGNNTSTSSRNTTITATYSGRSATCTVTQTGGNTSTTIEYEISISPTSRTFGANGGSYAFTVTCYQVVKTYVNGSLTGENRTAYSGYSTAVTGTGFTVSGNTVTAATNESTNSRSGTFRASVGSISASATLLQEGKFEVIID